MEVTSGVAAVMGAVVGGLASLTSTLVGERSRHRRDLIQREISRRETTYSEFIEQASKLYVESATHQINDDDAEIEEAVSLYAVASRIRLFASEQVIEEAEKVLDQIIRQYGAENISVKELRESKLKDKDPLKAFSITCRYELQAIQRGDRLEAGRGEALWQHDCEQSS